MTPKICEYRTRVNKRMAAYEAARQQCRDENAALEAAQANATALRAATAIAQQTAQTVQAAAHKQVADVVSRSLEAVFDEPYEFRIAFEQKRGRTEAKLTFERNGHGADPMTAAGGGVVDVAAFALRLSSLLLSRPPLRRLLVLDEPFKFLSAEYRPRVRQLLHSLASELGVQIVMVTHLEELKTGTVVQL